MVESMKIESHKNHYCPIKFRCPFLQQSFETAFG
jgi:hypothetical protein